MPRLALQWPLRGRRWLPHRPPLPVHIHSYPSLSKRKRCDDGPCHTGPANHDKRAPVPRLRRVDLIPHNQPTKHADGRCDSPNDEYHCPVTFSTAARISRLTRSQLSNESDESRSVRTARVNRLIAPRGHVAAFHALHGRLDQYAPTIPARAYSSRRRRRSFANSRVSSMVSSPHGPRQFR